jgi:hypothetical protein
MQNNVYPKKEIGKSNLLVASITNNVGIENLISPIYALEHISNNNIMLFKDVEMNEELRSTDDNQM